MNYWNHPYPESFESLIKKSEANLAVLLQQLNDSECKTLDELYKFNNVTNEVKRQKKVFDELGYKPNSRLNKSTKVNNEIKGLYIFGESIDGVVKPIYIGISGTIFRRLKQHGWGKQHNEATFAYLIASSKSNHIGGRKLLPPELLIEQQKLIRQFKVVILPEVLDYDLYFLEVYLAGRLKTHWNTFKTH